MKYLKEIVWAVFLIFVIIVMWAAMARAAPYLVCDPQTGVAEYVIEVNGTEYPSFFAESDGSMRYDLQGLAEGDYTIRAKAGNQWGWSSYSDPFVFNVMIPLKPSNVKITP